MLSPCRCTAESRSALRAQFGLAADAPIAGVEVEFREVPYFLVSRSRQAWSPTSAENINELQLAGLGERGLLVDPDGEGKRLTLVPWQNVISLTISNVEASSDKGPTSA